ncbi:MAG: hypothetical protein F6K11_24140 [Leptolyngbya sp. SIO3F4]|nr:hypothetical protein [Leptolyngbya sp. SIO3F4]
MKYLPFENITYKTQLDPDEILKRLSEVIEPKKTIRMKGMFGNNNHKPYEGRISKNIFIINRIITYRNSFIPTIKGIIEKDNDGTKIHVKMRLHEVAMVFMFIWFGGVGIALLIFLVSMFNDQHFEPIILIPFGMLIFGYVLVTAGFKYESIKSKKYLTQLFEAEIEE